MGNLVFATDIHLNHVEDFRIRALAYAIMRRNPDVVLIGGDISEAPELEMKLRFLEMHLKGVPIYFVCGNHDYYNGSIRDVRKGLRKRFKAGQSIWLPTAGVVTLAPGVALVGHDSWYDGGYPKKNGDWWNSMLGMNDYFIILELGPAQCQNRSMQYKVIQKLAKEGADHIKKYLPLAFKNHDKVFYMQHVSPFAETSRGPDGKMSDPDWMPHFCSRQSGEAILQVMKKQPADKQLTVLCGHSHTEAWDWPLPNVYCYCGPAQYGRPKVAKVFSY